MLDDSGRSADGVEEVGEHEAEDGQRCGDDPRVENTLPRSKSPRVAKLGVAVKESGNSVNPMISPIAAVNRMLMISAPGTFLVEDHRDQQPDQGQPGSVVFGNMNWTTGVPGRSDRFLWKPMNMMKSPIPTPIAL